MVRVQFLSLFESLRNAIGTLDLTCKASYSIEKVFWALIGVLGTVWAIYFIGQDVLHWSTNPTIITQSDVNLAEIDQPSITICPPGSTKFAIAERLGNYLDPLYQKEAKFLSLANLYLTAFLNFNTFGFGRAEYDTYCPGKDIDRKGCKVSLDDILTKISATANLSRKKLDMFCEI